jgi:5-methylcytosine-specific restriction endonuclease McrA
MAAVHSRAWRAANREHVRVYNADYWARHRDRYLTRLRAGRAKQRFGQAVHWSVYARIEQLPCFACGQTPAGGVDHVIPKAKGGLHVVENLQPACLPCNQHKSAN